VIMSEVTVVRQRQGRYRSSVPPSVTPSVTKKVSVTLPSSRPTQAGEYRLLGVVASTGGPQALVKLFNDLGSDFPLPILLIQHITAAFVDSFARWLESVCPLPVVIAEEGTEPLPGHIYIAPADCHLTLAAPIRGKGLRPYLHLDNGPLVSGQRPSGTRLFASLSEASGLSSIGVLLTGMGDDGADGLLALRTAGGYTIAEDQSTAVVYGMPAAAVQRGAAIQCLPLPEIGNHIRHLISPSPHVEPETEERSASR